MYRLLLVYLFFLTSAYAKSVDVLYIVPNESIYYKNTLIPMKAAAAQLGINLTIKHLGEHSEATYETRLLELINSSDKPDWLIWRQYRFGTQPILDTLKERGIKSIDITGGAFKGARSKIGFPQQYYKLWMAQVLTDEFNGGKRLASGLIEIAKQRGQRVKLIAIAGSKDIATVIDTVSGMQQAIGADNDASLLQVVHVSWSRKSAQIICQKFFSRYKQVDAIWAGNTDIALGIVEQLDNMQLNQKLAPVIANLGWSKDVFSAIKKGKIAFSLGANHLNGLWALILIHDIEHGVKLLAPLESTLFKSPYVKASKENLALIEPFFTAERWQRVDIKAYSKVYNPNLSHYNFDFSLLLK